MVLTEVCMLDAETVSASPVDELVPFTIHYIYDDEDTKLGGGEQPEQVRYGTRTLTGEFPCCQT